ncbi:hypothetical protein [Sphingobacterium sp. MYb382]|uniref:hypothetical protein n=1 Tax=Sphingobacterium sp. MYb382 TaxID=2745278 RepID=UPI0030AA78B8
MMSTICLLFFFGFLLWMRTSKRVVWKDKGKLLEQIQLQPDKLRAIAGGIILIASVLCIWTLGLASGIFAAIVLLMAMGSLVVLFFPLQYVGLRWLTGIYVVALILEIYS